MVLPVQLAGRGVLRRRAGAFVVVATSATPCCRQMWTSRTLWAIDLVVLYFGSLPWYLWHLESEGYFSISSWSFPRTDDDGSFIVLLVLYFGFAAMDGDFFSENSGSLFVLVQWPSLVMTSSRSPGRPLFFGGDASLLVALAHVIRSALDVDGSA